ILYAEDNDNDVLLVQMALQRSSPDVLLKTVPDGQEALAYLAGEGKYANRNEYPIPHFLLLDLKMPRLNGIELLEWIRSQPRLRNIPVIMLTASLEMSDQERCYALGANSFVIKPNSIDDLIAFTGLLSKYWLQWNRASHIEVVRV
ncbi:MAG: response regulator, partial [Limisphaerales bacterium]